MTIASNKRKRFQVEVAISKKSDVTIDDIYKALQKAEIKVRNVSLLEISKNERNPRLRNTARPAS